MEEKELYSTYMAGIKQNNMGELRPKNPKIQSGCLSNALGFRPDAHHISSLTSSSLLVGFRSKVRPQTKSILLFR